MCYVVYENGSVCISILHSPGIDEFNEFVLFSLKFHSQETQEERWRPILSVEAILISVQNMLSEPNDSSPANIDAAVSFIICFLSCRNNTEKIDNSLKNALEEQFKILWNTNVLFI